MSHIQRGILHLSQIRKERLGSGHLLDTEPAKGDTGRSVEHDLAEWSKSLSKKGKIWGIGIDDPGLPDIYLPINAPPIKDICWSAPNIPNTRQECQVLVDDRIAETFKILVDKNGRLHYLWRPNQPIDVEEERSTIEMCDYVHWGESLSRRAKKVDEFLDEMEEDDEGEENLTEAQKHNRRIMEALK